MASSAVRLGTRVMFHGTYPWEFGTDVGVGPHHGRVVEIVPATASDPAALIVRVDEPFVWREVPYDRLRFQARHGGRRNEVTALGRSGTPVAFAPVDPRGDLFWNDRDEIVFVVGDVRLADGEPRGGLAGLLDRLRGLGRATDVG